MTSMYKQYGTSVLRVLLNAQEPMPVNLVLDRETVDFLLALNTGNRPLRLPAVWSIVDSIKQIGWKSTETLCVTVDRQLGNGQHRLNALKQLGYPANICATVVFGVDRDAILAIDQHNKRSAAASIKFATGKNYSTSFLAAVRHDMVFDPDEMTFRAYTIIPPSAMADKIDEWCQYEKEMPLLFHRQVIGTKTVSLTAPMILAIVHYRQRAGLAKANDFLLGFWGERQRTANSPEQKAMDYRVTMLSKRGKDAESRAYRLFVRMLVAHYEGRRNPRLIEAIDWGTLRNK